MRILGTLLGLVTVSIARYPPASNANQIQQFDCLDRPDGKFAVGDCVTDYVQCVSGLAYPVQCQENLVYVAANDRCDIHSVCSVSPEAPAETSTNPVYTTAPANVYKANNDYHDYDHQVEMIDCSTLVDGFYSHGCTSYYTICSFGVSTQVDCPSGLLFHQLSGVCEWPSFCLSSEGSIPAIPVQAETAPTISGNAPSSTESASSVVSQRNCVEAEVSAYGDCSSKFRRCRNGIWTGALCPGATVFDASLGLCVYDLPQCKTDMFNPAIPTSPPVDVSSPSYNGIEQSVPYESQAYVASFPEGDFTRLAAAESDYSSNPFFALRHKNGRHHHKHHGEREHEERAISGKMRYSSRSTWINDRTHHVADGLDGKVDHYVYQNYQPTFPHSFKPKKSSLKNVLKSIDNNSNTNELVEPLLVVDSGDKAISSELEDLDIELGSGVVPDFDKNNRDRRSYSLEALESLEVNICSTEQSGALVSMGSCRQDFMFCPKTGTQIRAACAVGDLFDSDAKLCVLLENCGGRSIALSDSATETPVSNPRATRILAADPCEGRVDGPLAVGCSVSFVVCQNNVGIEMSCTEGLVFDEGRGLCDHKERVAICGGTTGDSSFAESLLPIALPYHAAESVSQPTSYKTVEVASSTMESLSSKVFPTSSVDPYAVSTLPQSPIQHSTRAVDNAASRTSTEQESLLIKMVECSDVPTAFAKCDKRYTICSKGLDYVMSCDHRMVFDSVKKVCDHSEVVSECSEVTKQATSPVPTMAFSSCRGFEHGAYIADEQDCTIFYRCMWNKLEKLHCPEKTVFNPVLSMCDWISNVPSCKNNNVLINSYY